MVLEKSLELPQGCLCFLGRNTVRLAVFSFIYYSMFSSERLLLALDLPYTHSLSLLTSLSISSIRKMQQAAGLSTCLYGHSAVIYGGRQNHYLHYLDLLSLEWQVDRCGGSIPPPTLFQSAVVSDRYLYVCGGTTISEAADDSGIPNIRPSIAYRSMRPLRMYRLDMAQLEWELVEASGAVPTDRSHHSMAIAGGAASSASSLVLLGGKPIGQMFTAHQFRNHFDRVSFFDPYILDLKTSVWRRVDLSETHVVPRLWGHSLCSVDSGTGVSTLAGGLSTQTFLIHGGVELSMDVRDENSSDEEALGGNAQLPLAEINSSVYVLNVDTRTCTMFPPRDGELSPPPRFLHNALLRGRSELAVIGGLVLDSGTSTTVVPALEMWSWSPVSGAWRPSPFCYDEDHAPPPKPYPFSKFPAVVYGDTVVVLSTDLALVHLYDGARWSTMPCVPPSPPMLDDEDSHDQQAKGRYLGGPFEASNLLPDDGQIKSSRLSTRDGASGAGEGEVAERNDVEAQLQRATDDVDELRDLVHSAVRAAGRKKGDASSVVSSSRAVPVGFSLSDVAQRTLRGVYPGASLAPVLGPYASNLVDDVTRFSTTDNTRAKLQDKRAIDPAGIRELLAQDRQKIKQRFSARLDDPLSQLRSS